MSESRVEVLADADEVAERAADVVLEAAQAAIAERGTFRIALAGGSTPRRTYQRIAERARSSQDAAFGFDRWQVFFGDERFVPADDPDSNYRMAREALLDHVAIPAAQVHRVPTERPDADEAARRYSETLRREFDLDAGAVPRFDLVLLGIGSDGHTASLFPGSSALVAGDDEIAVATWVERLQTWRVTLTLSVLNAAREAVFLVTGADKAPVLHSILGPANPAEPSPPAARVAGARFLVDAAAASLLDSDG